MTTTVIIHKWKKWKKQYDHFNMITIKYLLKKNTNLQIFDVLYSTTLSVVAGHTQMEHVMLK